MRRRYLVRVTTPFGIVCRRFWNVNRAYSYAMFVRETSPFPVACVIMPPRRRR